MNRRDQRDSPTAADSLTEYLDEIGRYRLLGRREERALGRRIRHGDQEAANELVCANLRFVVAVAKQYQNRAVSLLDLIDEGNLGLIRAAHRFDERKGIKFISYAVWWIRQAILHGLAQQSRIVRVPFHRTGTLHRIAMTIPQADVSLDAPLTPGEEGTLLDYLPDRISPAPDEQTIQESVTESIDDAVATLGPREARILRLYFGLNGLDPLTLEGIGTLSGITRERVRQIRDRALRKLRATMSYLAVDGATAAATRVTRRRPPRAVLLKEHRRAVAADEKRHSPPHVTKEPRRSTWLR